MSAKRGNRFCDNETRAAKIGGRLTVSICPQSCFASEASATLAHAPALKRHDLASTRRLGDLLGYRLCQLLSARLRQLLGDAEHVLALPHLGPDLARLNAGRRPDHDQVVDQIGTFLDDGVRIFP